MSAPAKPLPTVKRLTAPEGTAFLSCGEALTRALIDQRRADAACGDTTAGFVSGYRGSPLGRFDRTLEKAGKILETHDIVFQPGLNEELAATALYGTQQAALFQKPKVEGVFGLWYAKGPGVDRAGDALKHANFAGTSAKGGVVAVAGDDHEASSSTLPHQSEYALMAAHVPVFAPHDVQSAYDLTLAALAASRASGFWIGLKLSGDVAEASATVTVGPEHATFEISEVSDVHARARDRALDQEKRLAAKRRALHAFVRANGLDRVSGAKDAQLMSGAHVHARVGIVAVGSALGEVHAALKRLGIDDAARHGIRIYAPALVWPLEPQGLSDFAEGLEQIVVVEDKRPLVEGQIKELLFNKVGTRACVVGKTDENGNALLPENGRLSAEAIAAVLARYLGVAAPTSLRAVKPAKDEPRRTPHYCPGCPHGTSTRTPEGATALAGIGCHTMALWTDPNTMTLVPMGNEGAAWIGLSPFVEAEHVFQNLGDGTFVHSGILAVRAAIAARTTMTFKLLWNGAVAMTGGQSLDAALSVPKVAQELAAEGVAKIVVINETSESYRESLPSVARVVGREQFDAVQDELRHTPGVTVLIYDQPCAAELSRQRAHGAAPQAERRVHIDERLCEGCGDCTAKTNCLAVVPVQTPYGEKRRIDQDACTQDLTCLEGLCPAIVTVTGAKVKRSARAEIAVPEHLQTLPVPIPQRAPDIKNMAASILIAGVGGRGVVTMARILARAALNDGMAAAVLDQTGLAQKGGAVLSHVRIGDVSHPRIGVAAADLVIGLDPLVAAGSRVIEALTPQGHMLLASEPAPTAKGGRDARFRPNGDTLIASIATQVGEARITTLAAERMARVFTGRAIAANLIVLGFAFQSGALPLSETALLDAIADTIGQEGGGLVGAREAFLWGRRAAADPQAIAKLIAPPQARTETLADLIERFSRELIVYQNRKLADRFVALVERAFNAETTRTPGLNGLAEAVARNYFKLLTAKDEYEAARLLTSDAFETSLAATFTATGGLHYHLAFGKQGGRKVALKRWVKPPLRILAKFKILRGTIFDPFAAKPIRRLERALIAGYETSLDLALAQLSAANHARVVELAALPDSIRGFGAVKEKAAAQANARQADLIAAIVATGGAATSGNAARAAE